MGQLTALCRFDGRLCKVFHLYEPLIGKHRFDNGVASVTFTYRNYLFLSLYKIACLLPDLSPMLYGIHIGPCPSYFPASSFMVASRLMQDRLSRFALSPYFKVVRVVSRCNFNGAGSLLRIRIRVCDDREFLCPQAAESLFFPTISLYLSSSGCTAIATSPNIVSGLDVATIISFPPSSAKSGYLKYQYSPFLSSCSTSASEREVPHCGHQLIRRFPL